jgi:hypothetical protein
MKIFILFLLLQKTAKSQGRIIRKYKFFSLALLYDLPFLLFVQVFCPLPPKGGFKTSLVIKPPLPLRDISPKGAKKANKLTFLPPFRGGWGLSV